VKLAVDLLVYSTRISTYFVLTFTNTAYRERIEKEHEEDNDEDNDDQSDDDPLVLSPYDVAERFEWRAEPSEGCSWPTAKHKQGSICLSK